MRIGYRVKNMIVDITNEFQESSTPGVGNITYGIDYDRSIHNLEILAAEWLVRTFGGDLVLLTESKRQGEKTPDFEWRGELWENKNLSTRKFSTVDDQLRKANQQIHQSKGGILLDFSGSGATFEAIVNMVKKSADRRIKESIPVIVRKKAEYIVLTQDKK